MSYRDPKIQELKARRDIEDHKIREEGRLAERRRILSELAKFRNETKGIAGKRAIAEFMRMLRKQGRRV